MMINPPGIVQPNICPNLSLEYMTRIVVTHSARKYGTTADCKDQSEANMAHSV